MAKIHPTRPRAAAAVASFLAIALLATAAAAQGVQYESLPVHEGLAKDRARQTQVKFSVYNVLRGDQPLAANQAVFDAWHKQFVFARMTQYDNESLGNLPKERQDFLKQLQRASSDEARQHLNRLTLDEMTRIAMGHYHPAVRYNAMLLIGELNDVETQLAGSGRQPPEPMMDALPILLRELDSPQQIDAVRVAALIGILRHCEMNYELSKMREGRFKKEDMQRIIDRMLALINQKQPPTGRTLEGHQWMQRRAIDVLGQFGRIDAGGSVARELDTIVGDSNLPLSLRCTAASAIGRLTFTDSRDFNAIVAAGRLGTLALEACQSELDRIDAETKEREEHLARRELIGQSAATGGAGPIGPRTGGEGFAPGAARPVTPRPPGGHAPIGPIPGPGIFPGGPGSLGGLVDDGDYEDPYKLDMTKRRLKHRLASVRLALSGSEAKLPTGYPVPKTGLAQRARANEKPYVDQMIALIDELLNAADADVVNRDALVADVRTRLSRLEAHAEKGQAPAGGPAPAPAPAAAPLPGDVPGAPPAAAPPADFPGADFPM